MVQAKLAAVAVAALAAGAHPAPKSYYLVLGDSVAYGLQPDKVDAKLPPRAFHGFADLVAARLRKSAPTLRVVNYSCPGESTRTMVEGGCPWLADQGRLHDRYRGSQVAAALAFLRSHAGQVRAITITLGGNDLNEVADACAGKVACIRARAPAAILRFGSRLSGILEPIRSTAPDAEIVLTGLYNFNADDLARTDPFFRSINGRIAYVARRLGARYANLFALFNPQGSRARERARICAYTFICSKDDPHPTDAGYRAIAAAVLRAARY